MKLIFLSLIIVLLGVGGYMVWHNSRQSLSTYVSNSTSTISEPAKTNITLDMLKNGEFISGNGEKLKFSNWTANMQEDKGGSSWIEIDSNYLAFGDLNGDGQENAAILISNVFDYLNAGGSSGRDLSLAIISLGSDGIFHILAEEGIIAHEQFYTIDSVSIQSSTILVKVKDFNNNNTILTGKYKLAGNKIVDAATGQTPAALGN